MAPAPMYESFAAVTLLVLGLLVLLARASQAMFEDPAEAEGADDEEESQIPATGAARIERHADTGQSRPERREREILDDVVGETGDGTHDETGDAANDETGDIAGNHESPWEDPDETPNPWEGEGDAEPSWNDNETTDDRSAREPDGPDELEFTTGALLANVAVSQGVFGAAIVGAAWLANVPPAALGVELGDPWNVGLPAVGLGVGVGVVLYVANELSAKAADTAGIDYSEGLRESLAPDTPGGWVVLLVAVLPIIAGFEELLFRAALVGAFSAGFGVSPWILAAFSTVAFAIGHGAQGPGGVAVTGLLGFALAAAFVLTESLLVVVVAHYLVNALEFGVHEGLGVDWV